MGEGEYDYEKERPRENFTLLVTLKRRTGKIIYM